MTQITVKELAAQIKRGCNLLDLRSPESLASGYIKQSIAVDPNQAKLAEWVGQHLYYPVDKTVLITDNPAIDLTTCKEAIGLPDETSIFFLSDISKVTKEKLDIDMVIPVSVEEFALDAKHDKTIEVVDLREESDFTKAHLKQAVNVPWSFGAAMVQEYELNDKLYLLSHNAAIAWTMATLLRFNGFNFVRPVEATIVQLEEAGLSIVRKKKK